ncbi:MAG: DPP IV N-terminal domain-containing protein [Pseudomonadales bacterium]|nr:DPP IV N-terminal domain-containing protein [Pseudomonadales bacterium]
MFERLDLWEYHIQDATARMLVDSSTLMDSGKLLSDEEKARRERLRIFQTGIVEYFWSPDGSALLFPLNGDLWLYRLDTDEPLVQLTRSDTFETDIQFSPDGQHIAFVREQNLFVIELAGGTETQLTSDGSGTLSNGLPEFIAQEEMHRYEGYWWSPDSTRIAYLQVDEAPVEISQRYEIDADQFGVYDQRYPFAGTPNAEVRLGVIELSDTPDTSWIPLQRDPETYLPRINWFADSRHLAVQIQSRDQQNLLLCRVACDGSSQQTLLTETSATWINLHNNFRSLAATDEFIWASERTGYLHLYRVANDGSSITPLTEGDWVVTDIRGIDEQTGKIWFEGFADTPLEKHLTSVYHRSAWIGNAAENHRGRWFSYDIPEPRQTVFH